MNYKKGDCKGCGNNDWIVNKRHVLCPGCNRIRLDKNDLKSGKGLKQVVKSLKKRSKRGQEIHEAYKAECERRVAEVDQVCTGCGQRDHLSNSHLYPRSMCHRTARLELISEPDNITYHCIMDSRIVGSKGRGCHDLFEQKWNNDNHLISSMLDFAENIAYLGKIDYLYVKRMYGKVILD